MSASGPFQSALPPPPQPGLLESLLTPILLPLMRLFNYLGLNQPWQRGVAGLALGYLAVEVLHPSWMYDQEGNAKVWALTAGEDTEAEDQTWVPFWMIPLILAVLFGVFI